MNRTPFSYFFLRTVNRHNWTVSIECPDAIHVTIQIERGPGPFWHTFENGTCLDQGAGQHCVKFICSRLQALRYAACAIANLHGGSIGANGNMPTRPFRIWTPKALKKLLRDIQPTGPWIEFDCVNFDYRTNKAAA